MGYLVRGPFGGMAWSPLQYVLGFAALGHDVYYLEDSDDYCSCYDPAAQMTGTDPTFGLGFARDIFDRLGMGDRWAYHDAHTQSWHGPAGGRMIELCATADLLVNLAALNPIRPWLAQIPQRVMVDGESVFTQLRHLTKPNDRRSAEQHSHFFTFAENYGRDGCTMPEDGFTWHATRHPIALEAWPLTPGMRAGRFTSVLSWDSVPPVEYAGSYYGMKSTAFEEYLDLPGRVGPVFELAASRAPREMLLDKGWFVPTDAQMNTIVRDPWTYQQFIHGSKGEFCINRHGFVATRSGWFSERSAAYMATGRPVLSLDTGFSNVLPTGEGLFAFSSPQQVHDAIAMIDRDYEHHCRMARRIAEEYFDAGKVLQAMLNVLG